MLRFLLCCSQKKCILLYFNSHIERFLLDLDVRRSLTGLPASRFDQMQIVVGPSLAVDQTSLASIHNCWQSTSGTIKTKRNINLNANADGQSWDRSVVHYGKRFSFEWKWGNATDSGTSSTTRRQFSVENSHGVRRIDRRLRYYGLQRSSIA